MLCEFCGKNEAIIVIENINLCHECEKDIEKFFFSICQNCGTFWKIQRGEQGVKNLLEMQILGEMIIVIKEIFYSQIKEIVKQDPVFFLTTICPSCQKERKPAKKTGYKELRIQ